MKQLTKEQAIAFAENKCWESMNYRQRAEFQMEQDRLCMPLNIFLEALKETLGRSVFTHELAFRDEIRKELYGEKEPPTFEEICALIQEEKLIEIKL